MVCGDANWKGAGTREERKHEARPMCACILQAGCACYMGTQGRYTEEEGEENEIGKEGSVAPMYLCGGGISNDHRVVYLIAGRSLESYVDNKHINVHQRFLKICIRLYLDSTYNVGNI